LLLNFQRKPLGQQLRDVAAKYPDNDAVVYVDRDFRQTWREFDKSVDEMAKGLMALGVKRGEKVAIWATNVPHWVTLMLAVARIGGIYLTINTNYRDHELDFVLKQSDMENLLLLMATATMTILTPSAVWFRKSAPSRGGSCAAKPTPTFRRAMFLGVEKHRGFYSMPELIGMGAAMISDDEFAARQAEVDCEDVVMMQYTSGTTGFPKGVMLTHANLINNGSSVAARQAFDHNDRICLPVPMFHCFGCSLGVMASISSAAAMVILESFKALHVMASIDHEKCTAMYGVPTMFLNVLEHKMFRHFDYSTMRTGIMAGSVCPEPVMRRVADELNMTEITSVYGLTESSPGMTQSHCKQDSLDRRVTTVGRRFPGVDVCLFNPETGEECPRGVAGEVCCKGHNVMKGYYKMPKETDEAIKDGWLHSGDLGIMDEEGFITITGRIKDLIIRGGENISPKEVEEFLYSLEGVEDVQVVGVPSRKYGEEVGAFIIPKKGYESLAPEDVKDFLPRPDILV
jgi:Acyl-CoA synthetases (AMP-forming)/AMP-acid ligases II